MKRLGVFLLPPGWDASPSHGYPPELGVERGTARVKCLTQEIPKNTTQCPRPGLEPRPLDPETCALHSFFFIRIYFIRISRLTFAKYFQNKAEAEILKRIDIILCVETGVLMQCNFIFLT